MITSQYLELDHFGRNHQTILSWNEIKSISSRVKQIYATTQSTRMLNTNVSETTYLSRLVRNYLQVNIVWIRSGKKQTIRLNMSKNNQSFSAQQRIFDQIMHG